MQFGEKRNAQKQKNCMKRSGVLFEQLYVSSHTIKTNVCSNFRDAIDRCKRWEEGRLVL